jgi:hypothetical protein
MLMVTIFIFNKLKRRSKPTHSGGNSIWATVKAGSNHWAPRPRTLTYLTDFRGGGIRSCI